MALTDTTASVAGMEGRSPGRTIHVLHLIETLGPGGAERLLFTNLRYLSRDDFRHTVVTVFSRDPYWLEPIRGLGVDVLDLGCRGYGDLGRGVWSLWSVLRRTRPDLVHTHLWAADVVGRVAGRLAGVPVISSIHNMEYDAEARVGDSFSLGLKRGACLLADRWTARLGARRLIAVSEYISRTASRLLRFPTRRIDLIYNPIDFDEIGQVGRSDGSDAWGELGLPPGSTVLLNVGRVSPQKGLIFAIRALPEILGRFPDAHVVSVGSLTDEAYVSALRSEAERLGVAHRFHTLGPRRDVPTLLRSCDLFIFPSLYEGMGIALVEAMAVGCVCVASDVGPLPELVRHGHDGWLVPARDPGRLAEAVCLLLGAPGRCAALAQAAAVSPPERFHPVDTTNRLAAVYRSVL
jgi:glycosyltransferase involved in cell wall biosynthesis